MSSSTGGGSSGPAIPNVEGAVGPQTTPRLTVAQYRNAIGRLFGPGIAIPPLESDDRPEFYSVIGAARQPVTETGVSLFWEAAQSIAEQISKDESLRTRLVPCDSAPSFDPPCAAQFLETTGKRLFRRPLTDEEMSRYSALYAVTAEGDLWQGLRFTLTALLASPAFLYRHESAVETERDEVRAYDDYSLASRLSFLTLNDGPDDELLQLAQGGRLREDGVLSEQLDRLYLAAVDRGMMTFFEEYLDLEAAGRLDFPGTDDEVDQLITEGMRHEVLSLVRDAIGPETDYRQLFSARTTYVNGPLAALYGVDGVTGSALVPVTLGDATRRAGLLTTGAFLTADGAQDRTKPTNRGLYVQFRLRCLSIPDPPEVAAIEESGDPTKTSVRAVLERHSQDPSCSACHQYTDPIGLAMEDFDQFGRYRSEYSDGSPVDATTTIDGTPVSGARELGAFLGEDPEVAACLVTQLYRYASARVQTKEEEPLIEDLGRQFAERGYRFQELLRGLVLSEGFRFATKEGSQ